MKIIHLIYDLSPGGAERFVVDLCNEQLKQGNDVTVLTVNNLAVGNRAFYLDELNKRVNVISLGNNKHISLPIILKVLRIINQEESDIVHIHTFPIFVYLPAIFSKSRIVWTIHSEVSYYIRKPIDKLLTSFLFQRHRLFPVTISEWCHKTFKDIYSNSWDIMVSNGRSQVGHSTQYSSVLSELAAYKLNSNTPVFIHVARYSMLKNQNLLFESFIGLYNEDIDFCLIVIGPGYNDDIIRKVERCPNIHILGPKKNVGDYLFASKYFVLSSLFEGLPISLLEAMSTGCVPISTPAGGVVDVINDGVTGFISQSNSIQDYTNTLKRALSENNVSSQNVIYHYRNNYSMEACAKKYHNLYCEITGSKQS